MSEPSSWTKAVQVETKRHFMGDCDVMSSGFTGDVNTTSHTLLLTCQCDPADRGFPIKQLRMLKINQEFFDYKNEPIHYLKKYRLALLDVKTNETVSEPKKLHEPYQ